MITNEEWRDIKGYEGIYQVSNLGNVRKSAYQYVDSNGVTFCRKPQNIVLVSHGNGYLYVSFTVHNKRKNHYVHRLVAEAFLPNPDNLPQVNHKDYDRSNNCVSNLEWVSVSENIKYSQVNQPRRKNYVHSATGHKHIYIRKGKYRVNIPSVRGTNQTDRCFNSMKEALEYRDYLLSLDEVRA